jgi:hypothetical protein
MTTVLQTWLVRFGMWAAIQANGFHRLLNREDHTYLDLAQ